MGITTSLTQFTLLPSPFLLPSFFPSFLPFSLYCAARAGCCAAPCDCRPVSRHLLQDSPTPGVWSQPSPQQLRGVFSQPAATPQWTAVHPSTTRNHFTPCGQQLAAVTAAALSRDSIHHHTNHSSLHPSLVHLSKPCSLT